MSSELDLLILPITRHDEENTAQPASVYVAAPPRRPARSRSSDRLFFQLALSGNAPLDARQQAELYDKLADIFFKTSGSVTSAMREAANQANQLLLERNLGLAGRGQQAIGLFTIAVLREDRLYLGQAGPVHALLATAQQVADLYDPYLAGRGLGVSRTVTLRFSQFELQAGDIYLISAQPSPAWTPDFLQDNRAHRLEIQRRMLIEQPQVDPQAVLVQARPGGGKLLLARPKPVAQPAEALTPSPEEAKEPVQALPASGITAPEPVQAAPPETLADSITLMEAESEPKVQTPIADEPLAQAEFAAEEPLPAAEAPLPVELARAYRKPFAASLPEEEEELEGDHEEPAAQPAAQPEQARAKRTSLPKPNLAPKLLGLFQGWRRFRRRLASGWQALLERILPEEAVDVLPASLMALIAVAVPIVVVAVASTVYFQRGRGSLFDDYLQQAQQLAVVARAQTELTAQRSSWQNVLLAVDEAEAYQVSDETASLRREAQTFLDSVDAIERLDYQPAIVGGLVNTVQISRILPSGDDLYLLNRADGSALHARLTADGYELDPNFVCGPTRNNGPLVDIVNLPFGNALDAALVGIDENGSVIYCRVDDAPLANHLPTHDSNWGKPTALTFGGGSLYVLDPLKRAVWIFESANQDLTYSTPPRFFFANQVPDLINAIDLAIYRDDLYILKADGRMTTCTYSLNKFSPTRCDDPAVYLDYRQGRASGETIADTTFRQVLYAPPPDPSIYLLDAPNRAIYHFSLRLALQRQYQPLNRLAEGDATAFSILQNRVAFLAIGSRLYYANIP